MFDCLLLLHLIIFYQIFLFCSKKRPQEPPELAPPLDQFDHGDVVLVQPSRSKSKSLTGKRTPPDDFVVGTPPPNVPLADAANDDGNSLMDIESIKHEEAPSKSKKVKAQRKLKEKKGFLK